MASAWAITDAGLVTAAGDTPEAVFEALLRGVPLTDSETASGVRARAIRGFDVKDYVPRKGVRDLSRTSQLACAAAARVASGLASLPAHEVGVAFGSAWGSLETIVDFEREACVEGPRFVDPIRFTETVANVPAGQVSIFQGWSAFNATISAGSASGTAAVLRALEFLVEGRASAAVAGGGDEMNLRVLRSLGRVDPAAGEGACFLTLEAVDHARARSVVPRAIVRGAQQAFEPDAAEGSGGGLAEVIRAALDEASLGPGDVDLVVLPLSGGEGDAGLRESLERVFPAGNGAPATIAPKLVLGETWGASGPLAIVAACEAMRTGTRHALVVDSSTSGHRLALVLGRP